MTTTKLKTDSNRLHVKAKTGIGGVTAWQIIDASGLVLAEAVPADKGKLHRLMSNSGFKPSQTEANVWIKN